MEWITELMEALGSPGAGLAVALENVFPPVPSEVILPLAGFTAGQGKLSLAGLAIAVASVFYERRALARVTTNQTRAMASAASTAVETHPR